MQLATIAPTQARTDVPTAPTTRSKAAKALASVPMGAVMVATMTAMTKQMAGQPASRAELVAPLFEKATAEQLKLAMSNAIDGAIAVAPELAERSDALRQAAAGVVALLQEAVADTAQVPAEQALEALTTPLQQVATPLLEAALVLDPSLGKEPTPAKA